jgi:glycosyltransferase involved in cell wall biosynthesis
LSTLEIILPLRNPTDVLEQTVKSLIGQTDRRFSVLISDNHSTQGAERLLEAAAQFERAGIVTSRIRPPIALGRVEHWNWAHHQATGEWLKPIFAGDWLEPEYVARLRASAESTPGCSYIFCAYVMHRINESPTHVVSAYAGRFYAASEMQREVLRNGMQFGPPSAAAFERAAFVKVGGYPTPLPICSDSLMFCALASTFGVLGLAEPLCHFNIHGARFSTSLPQKRKDTFRESLTYYFMLAYRAWADHVPYSKGKFMRLLWRETRDYLRKK